MEQLVTCPAADVISGRRTQSRLDNQARPASPCHNSITRRPGIVLCDIRDIGDSTRLVKPDAFTAQRTKSRKASIGEIGGSRRRWARENQNGLFGTWPSLSRTMHLSHPDNEKGSPNWANPI